MALIERLFYPKKGEFDYSGKIRIISVGNFNIEYKSILELGKAVRILKAKGKENSQPGSLRMLSPMPKRGMGL